MSTDPHSGIAFITMYSSVNGTLSDGVQFSGVLIAPDEILTAAHCVTGSSGDIRNYGTVCANYDGAPSSEGSVAIDGVHVLDASHSGTSLTDSSVSTDYAVLHLSRAIAGGAVFSLASALQGGIFEVDGYPAASAGRLAELQETLTPGQISGELTGLAIAGTADSRGGSGGPVWSDVSGTPVVVGIASGAASDGSGVFKALTAEDIAQIGAWVQADHSSVQLPSNTMNVAGTFDPASDGLDQLAAQLQAEAAAGGGARSQRLGDVASALAGARQDGFSYLDLPEATDQIASLLKNGSQTPNKSVAFMAGLMASGAGGPLATGGLLSYISTNFGLTFGKGIQQFVRRGYAESVSLSRYSETARPIQAAFYTDRSIGDLAGALHQTQSGAESSALVSRVSGSTEGTTPVLTSGQMGHSVMLSAA